MATSPPKAAKGNPAEETEAAAAPKKSKTMLIVVIALLILLLGAGGGGAWYFLSQKAKPAPTAEEGEITEGEEGVEGAEGEEGAEGKAKKDKKSQEAKVDPSKPPVFIVMEPFTVNLTTETTDQFLQVSFTLQVVDQAQIDIIKLYMPQVRSRLLLLLSSKKASEISSPDGKKKLAEEIIEQVKQPFVPGGQPQNVTDVFFTSFVIQ